MSAQPLPREFLSADAYLSGERQAVERREYCNGDVTAMAGGPVAHASIAANLIRVVGNALADRPCLAFGSDMKVRVDKANAFFYPDLSALCGPVLHPDGAQDAICNPSLIIEVLSDATEAYDRGGKFALYRLLDSLQEYMLVSQKERRVELYRRSPDGRWKASVFDGPVDAIELASIGCRIQFGDVYAKVGLAA